MIDIAKRITLSFVFFSGLGLPHLLSAEEKPNVVLIMADDIGYECYGAYGSEFYSTPNVDKLAREGARFDHAYSAPLCTPSRVKIMTGRYGLRNYTEFYNMDLSQPTFAKMVKNNGYKTVIAGKWQLSPENFQGPFEAGFDEYMLWNFQDKAPRYRAPTLYKNGERVEVSEDDYGPELVSDFICDFIARNKDEPFVAYYPMIHVHSPFDPTPDSPDWNKNLRRRNIERFRDMVEHMDRMIGKVVSKLEETGLRDKTLIMITGDNGTGQAIISPLPQRGYVYGGKGYPTDAGTHVAFVANWPSVIPAGTVVDSPIDFSDVLPTIADVTRSKVPENTDGTSFLDLMKGDESNARGWAFQSSGSSKRGFHCWVRTKDWKLYSDGRLFNAGEDVMEEEPVTGPEVESIRKELQEIMVNIVMQFPDRKIVREPKNLTQITHKIRPGDYPEMEKKGLIKFYGKDEVKNARKGKGGSN
ncbi:MAG: sulfatase-like hydrolase/transferase [bacterium]|nr:sulfatase-like hydrolase/transferase [bacterium]